MLINRTRKPRYGIQTPLTSLIDIVFLLLVYFLLTTNFMVDEGIGVDLPRAEASKPQLEKEITIYVDATGRAFLENREATLKDLFERLRALLHDNRDRLVLIKADRRVELEKAVRVMDAAKAAGAGRLCLATEKD
ncbi:MAG: biopolymer transporter ExbD [Pseudomonadota bacterium]